MNFFNHRSQTVQTGKTLTKLNGFLSSSFACRTKGFSLCQIMPLVLLSLVIISNLSGCATSAPFKNVSVAELKAAMNSGALILDVRQPEEYASGHVPGAKLLPLTELNARVQEVPADQTVFVICRSGKRSKTASELLAAKGKHDIRNVEGGMIAWQNAAYPIEMK